MELEGYGTKGIGTTGLKGLLLLGYGTKGLWDLRDIGLNVYGTRRL